MKVEFNIAHVPCLDCRHLTVDHYAWLGVRCVKGDAGDQCGDFSCYEAKPRRDGAWPPLWVEWGDTLPG